MNNVFFPGGPTFIEWLALEGVGLTTDRDSLPHKYKLVFQDSRQYTMFMLKYST